jgi:hypothetical protein
VSPAEQHCLEILYQAASSPLGLVVSVEDFTSAQAKFYSARRASGDPFLDCLQFRRSPYTPETEIWIVKRTEQAKEMD